MPYFLIYATAFFGDTLMIGALSQNLKRLYPQSYIVCVTRPQFLDVARYLEGIDEVWAFDKRGRDRGVRGLFAFCKKHATRYDFDAAFITFSTLRGICLAKRLGCKKIFAEPASFLQNFFLTQKDVDFSHCTHIQDRIAYLAELYSKKPFKSVKIRYNIPEEALSFVDEELLRDTEKPLVLFNPLTKDTRKDLKISLVEELISLFSEANLQAALIGAGKEIADYYKSLHPTIQSKTLDFSNKTTIPTLAALLKHATLLISADTGTAHLALAVDTPVVDIFYNNPKISTTFWEPKDIYQATSITGEHAHDAKYIFAEGRKLLEKTND